MLRVVTGLSLVLGFAAFAATDPDDSPDVKDHPDVPRFPGMVIQSGTSHDFGSHDFPDGKDANVTKEGASWEIGYGIKGGAKVPSPLEIFKNYENAFKKNGGSTVLKQIDSGGGEG